MRLRVHPLLLALVLLAGAAGLAGSAGGCGEQVDQVELRLYPCALESVEPRAVVVEITGFDAAGEIVETFEVGFDDIAAQTFDDGYATVGYRKDPAVVRARIRLGWFSSGAAGGIAEAEAVAAYEDLSVPGPGEVLELGAAGGDCSEIAGDGDGDGDGGPGDGDGEPGDGDGEPGDGDGDPGDGDPGDGDGDTGEDLPAPGDPCDSFNAIFQCVPEPDAQAGTPLFCNMATMMLEETDVYAEVGCADLCPEGLSNPVEACAGYGAPAKCLCPPNVPEACAEATLGCTDDDHLELCYAGTVVVAECVGCMLTPDGYYSCMF